MAEKIRCILLVIMMVLLEGCAFFDSDHEYFDIYYSLNEPASDEEKEDFEFLEEIYDSRLPEEYFSDDYGYYHQFLNREEAFMYRALLRGCVQYKAEIALDPISTESYLKVAQVFMMDHPEFYWTCYGSEYFTNYNDEVIRTKYMLHGTEESNLLAMYAAADELIASFPEGAGDYDKVKMIFEYVVNNCEYDPESMDNQDITSVFMYHKAVCAGYAKTFKFLCDRAGIPCVLVVGDAENDVEGGHAWDLVKIDGQYYWVDPTWGDPVTEDGSDAISYHYLCMDDEILQMDHTVDTSLRLIEKGVAFKVSYPSCTDKSLEYYRLHNAYFETYDRAAVRNFLVERLTSGGDATMCFADSYELIEAEYDLFTSRYIFEIIQASGLQSETVSYRMNDRELTLTVLLPGQGEQAENAGG